MSKKIRCIVLFFVMLLTSSFSVFAEEVYPELEDDPNFIEYLPDRSSEECLKNDKGQVIEGYFRVRYRRWVADDKAYSTCYSYDASTDESNYLYILFLESENDDEYNYYRLCGSDSAEVCRTYYYETTNKEFGTTVSDPVSVSFKSAQYRNGYALADYKRINSKAVNFDTNIPVFNADDEEAINAYVENGDYSGAINSDDLDTPPVEYDELVEKPQNVRTYGNIKNVVNFDDTKGQITVRWDVPQNQIDSYSYDLQVRVKYLESGTNFVWTGWSTQVSDYPYNGRDIYDLTTGEKVTRSSTLPEDFIVKQELIDKLVPDSIISTPIGTSHRAVSEIEVRIRNRCGNKCSIWVSTKKKSDNTNEVFATDDDGNIVDDEDYHGQDNDNSNQDTYYDTDYQDGGTSGTVNTDNVSVSSILGFIKSGFGLLGDNGIIALISRTYLYLPASIWTIIKFFVAMLVVIAIIGAIKEVL